MKFKKIELCLFFGLVVLLTGCSYERNKVVESTTAVDISDPIQSSTENVNTNSNEKSNQDLEKLIQDYVQDSMISSIHTITENILLVVYEKQTNKKAVFFDIKSGRIKSELNLGVVIDSLETEVLNKNILLYADNIIYILNKDLKIISRLDMEKVDFVYQQTMKRNYCVIPADKKIYFYMESIDKTGVFTALSRCDFDGENKEVLNKFYGPEQNYAYINGFHSLISAPDQSSIYFTGEYFESSLSGSQSKNCIGRYDIDIGEYDIKYEDKEKYGICSNGILYYDGILDNIEKSTGKLIFMNENESKEFTLEHKEESQIVYVNQFANHFYTYVAPEFGEKLSGQFSIYSLKTGKRQKTFTLKDNIQDLVIFEKQDLIILTSYNEQTKKVQIKVKKIGDSE